MADDDDVYTDDDYPKPRHDVYTKPRRKRRRKVVYISGWNVRVILTQLGIAAAVWGVVLGDVYLWRLLYG
jgi:hypothetical protein